MAEPEHRRRMAMEQMLVHLARAESELEAVHKFLDPKSGDEAELDVVRAVANARLCASDALETVKLMTGEPGG